jgi:uncharacterized protein (DUF2147 family)
MRKAESVLVASVVLLLAGIIHGQEPGADAILGNWLTDEGKAIVEMYRCANRYCGKIIWLKEPHTEDGTNKLDTKNPDPSKRNRTLIGLDIVWDFKYGGGGSWVDGRIYDPDNGKTYSCKMKLQTNQLKVRGYIGFSLIGRTTIWTRKR